MTQLSAEQIKNELSKVEQEAEKVTGQLHMRFMRPPRGIFSERMLDICRRIGYTNVFWSIAYKDWDVKQQKGWSYAYDNVMKQLHPGAVILLHAVSEDNANALGKIIDDARKQGYAFKSLDQLSVKNYR